MESSVWGLLDKGMNDKLEVWLVVTCEITQTSKDMRVCSDLEIKNMKRSCAQFKLDASKPWIHNKIMIGDLHRQAEGRGVGNRKTFHDLDRLKILIKLCRRLNTFSCEQSNLGWAFDYFQNKYFLIMLIFHLKKISLLNLVTQCAKIEKLMLVKKIIRQLWW